jgi:hypothetical protein
MSENAIDSGNTSKPSPDTTKPKGAGKPGKRAKPGKKAARAKKSAGKPKADRPNKKAQVTDDETRQGRDVGRDHEGHGLAAAHRSGVRQHPGQQGGEKIESSANAAGERTYRDREVASGNHVQTPPRAATRGGVPAFEAQGKCRHGPVTLLVADLAR